jgi:3,4-dihydroxy 2-butanone 4-phosphate synthase/GTP cyclohydrolase II
MPGHTFPLRARPGGVLARTGQTEASVDLARLAGLHPSGVICEIMKDDGSMARVPDLTEFCEARDLLMVTVADLVAYRLQKDPIVQAVESREKETRWGRVVVHTFQNTLDKSCHLAFQIGDTAKGIPLVRVHVETLPDDLEGFGAAEPSAFAASMSAIQRDGCGVLVFLRQEPAQDPAHREIGVGSQILGRLGVTKMRLLARREKRYVGLEGFGLDIVSQVQLESLPE